MSDNQQQPNPVICPQCGQTNAQGRQECWNCKRPLVQSAEPPRKKNNTTCWIVGCVISLFLAMVLLVIGVAGYFFARHSYGPGMSQQKMEEKMIEEAIKKSIKEDAWNTPAGQNQIENEIKKEIEKQIMEDALKGSK